MEYNNDRFVEEFGAQGELLVFVHGLGGSTNTWFPQSQILKRDLRPVAYDLPGSGRTPVRENVTIDSLVADLNEVVEHAGGTARVHLAGHSLGTIICQHYAARYPDRVASLALIGAFPEPPEAARKALRDRAAKVRAEGMAAIADAIVTAGTSDDTKANNPAAASFVRESIMAQPAEGYARACEALAALSRADLSAVRCPTLVLNGDQDRTSPPDTGSALAGAIEGAEFRKLDGCGHWATIERAKQVNYAMTLFYARQRSSKAA
ncbi:MAG TPA: alpha/beta fold hydrolase [Acidisoma sp.]|jgi:3-oxoadipate enol-lactonase|uniref:alpha/beta fold hydrolase n=1 Tax=Acidisoma sp. TaxID=1872115 RepID=UPI002C1A2AB1|nr:alpha/beta fold hydrolase [Acidisoma sp.]HTH99586.1 alpha/beta fold hydrolase [Acidisoma sp.]